MLGGPSDTLSAYRVRECTVVRGNGGDSYTPAPCISARNVVLFIYLKDKNTLYWAGRHF